MQRCHCCCAGAFFCLFALPRSMILVCIPYVSTSTFFVCNSNTWPRCQGQGQGRGRASTSRCRSDTFRRPRGHDVPPHHTQAHTSRTAHQDTPAAPCSAHCALWHQRSQHRGDSRPRPCLRARQSCTQRGDHVRRAPSSGRSRGVAGAPRSARGARSVPPCITQHNALVLTHMHI